MKEIKTHQDLFNRVIEAEMALMADVITTGYASADFDIIALTEEPA